MHSILGRSMKTCFIKKKIVKPYTLNSVNNLEAISSPFFVNFTSVLVFISIFSLSISFSISKDGLFSFNLSKNNISLSLSLLVNFFGRNSRSRWDGIMLLYGSEGSSYFFAISALGSLSKFETAKFLFI